MNKIVFLIVIFVSAFLFSSLPVAADDKPDSPTAPATSSTTSDPISTKSAEDAAKTVEKEPEEETFGVPIPVVGTSPNSGATLGVLLAVVSEKQGRITSILAPVFMSNDLFGNEIDINYFGFPAVGIGYQLLFSHTTENFWDYSAEYHHAKFLHQDLRLDAEFEFFRSPTERFYGIGPQTTEDDESSYTLRQVGGYATLTMRLIDRFFGSFSIKARRMWPRKGVVEEVTTLQEKFPNVVGVNGSYTMPIELGLIYDSRDDLVSPTSGIYARMFLEIGQEGILSSFSFQRFRIDARAYISLDKESRFVTVIRGMLTYLRGDDIPFYELSMLGGDETLRGYGEGRFYDNHSILFNVEERIRLFRFLAGDILLDIETVLFIDIGQVFPSFNSLDFKDIKFVAGTGIRFVVRSQIVAKVDIGYGDEGMAIFAGLHYPF